MQRFLDLTKIIAKSHNISHTNKANSLPKALADLKGPCRAQSRKRIAVRGYTMRFRNGWLAIALALCCLAENVSAGTEPPSFSTRHHRNNTGTIIVYRPRSIIGAALTTWRFNLNHGIDYWIGNGTYCELTVLAGDSIISHDNVPFLEEDSQIVHVEPGQTVYFEYTAQLSLIFEVADNQEKAARTVSTLVPMEPQISTEESFTD
jgi:hypothetical protein